MFGVTNYWMFLTTGILLNITPGADSIFVLSRSAAQGRKVGVCSALGIGAGTLIQAALCGLGLAVLMQNSKTAFMVVKSAGAFYLICMGVRQFHPKSPKEASPTNLAPSGSLKYFFQAMLTNVLNPAVTLFLLTFLPQFISPDQPYGILPFLVLGATLAATGAAYCTILALFSARLTERLRAGTVASLWLNRLVGSAFVVLGVMALLYMIIPS